MLFCVLAFGFPGGAQCERWGDRCKMTHPLIKQNIFRISTLTKNFSGMILGNSHAK